MLRPIIDAQAWPLDETASSPAIAQSKRHPPQNKTGLKYQLPFSWPKTMVLDSFPLRLLCFIKSSYRGWAPVCACVWLCVCRCVCVHACVGVWVSVCVGRRRWRPGNGRDSLIVWTVRTRKGSAARSDWDACVILEGRSANGGRSSRTARRGHPCPSEASLPMIHPLVRLAKKKSCNKTLKSHLLDGPVLSSSFSSL